MAMMRTKSIAIVLTLCFVGAGACLGQNVEAPLGKTALPTISSPSLIAFAEVSHSILPRPDERVNCRQPGDRIHC
jgi:hypothetical protein